MVVEAAAVVAQHSFLHNDGDGTKSYLVDLEHIEQLRTALTRLKKLARRSCRTTNRRPMIES
jgi:hypothetical protein